MSYKKMLLPGLAVDLTVFEGEYAGNYRTRIEEVGERLLAVGAIFDRGQIIPLREGTKVRLTFWDKVSAYAFDAKIMQRIAVPVSLFVLEFPDSIAKVQRRNFVRVPAFYPISFQSVTKEGLSDLYKGTMLNLSGGGMCFSTKQHVENRSLLYAHLDLPDGEIHSPVRVCRVEKKEDGNIRDLYNISVEFHEIPERERDRIVRCVFDIQRAMRKKGLV